MLGTGRNDYGQLGLGHAQARVFGPHVIGYLRDKNVVSVAAGCYHSVAVTGNGMLYFFGRNNHGQLATGDTEDRHVPHPVDDFVGCRGVNVAAGFYHTVVVAVDASADAVLLDGLEEHDNPHPLLQQLVVPPPVASSVGVSMMLLSQRPSSVASAQSKSSAHNKHLHPEAIHTSNNNSNQNNNQGSSSQLRANSLGPGRPTNDVATRTLTHHSTGTGTVVGSSSSNGPNASSSSSMRGTSTDLHDILFAELTAVSGPRHAGTGIGTGTNDNNHPTSHTTNSAVATGMISEQQTGAIGANPPKQRSLSRPAGASLSRPFHRQQ